MLKEFYNHNQQNYNNPDYDFNNPMLEGETGSGKTLLCKAFCYKYKLPYLRFNLNGGTTTADLIGSFIPDTTQPNSSGGFKPRFNYGYLSLFAKHGGVLVLDEINTAPAEILTALNSLTDSERSFIIQDTGEIIKAHPNFFLICTLNPESYSGRKPLAEDFKSRFQKFIFNSDTAIEKKLIKNIKILDLAQNLRDLQKKGDIDTPISTRILKYYEQNLNFYGFDIATEFFINNFKEHEKKAVYDTIELKFKLADSQDLNTAPIEATDLNTAPVN
jgi:MoxR-like ATPase